MYTTFMLLLLAANIALICIAIYKEIKTASSNSNKKLIGAMMLWSACTTAVIITGVVMLFSDKDPRWAQVIYVLANVVTIFFSAKAL